MNRRPFVVNRDSDTEHVENHGPSFGRVMAEIRDEIKDFVQTRVQMFKSELQEKISVWKAGAGLAAAAVVLLATAYLLLTISVVCLVAVAFLGRVFYRGFGFFIVGVAWGLFRGMLGAFSSPGFCGQGRGAEETVRVPH